METEVKFSPVTKAQADALFCCSLFTPLSPARMIPMETTYFDDPAHCFSAHRWTLRLRREGSETLCTFKTALDNLSRLELEAPAQTIEAGAQALARSPELPEEARSILQRGAFFPICGARFQRREQRMEWRDLTFALSYDEGILFRGAHTLPLAEVELELYRGGPQALLMLAAILTQSYHLRTETRSKQQRALALGR